MHRLKDDRGAIAVLVAILMVPLLGFAAISIDIAAAHSERQQLQTGADAAALAIAQDCARNEMRCSTPQATAQQYSSANMAGDTSAAAHRATNQVRVTNNSVRDHWFAPVVGISSTDIHTAASAGWGSISGGPALPYAYNVCEFLAQTDGGTFSDTTEYELSDPKNSGTRCPGKNYGGNFVPGGFGWADSDAGPCSADSKINGQLSSNTGANPCDLSTLQNQTVVIPLFEDYGNSGNSAWYEVSGYFAFTVTGYNFPGERWNNPGCQRCLVGHLVKHVDQSGDFDYSPTAPDYGATVVRLLPDP